MICILLLNKASIEKQTVSNTTLHSLSITNYLTPCDPRDIASRDIHQDHHVIVNSIIHLDKELNIQVKPFLAD